MHRKSSARETLFPKGMKFGNIRRPSYISEKEETELCSHLTLSFPTMLAPGEFRGMPDFMEVNSFSQTVRAQVVDTQGYVLLPSVKLCEERYPDNIAEKEGPPCDAWRPKRPYPDSIRDGKNDRKGPFKPATVVWPCRYLCSTARCRIHVRCNNNMPASSNGIPSDLIKLPRRTNTYFLLWSGICLLRINTQIHGWHFILATNCPAPLDTGGIAASWRIPTTPSPITSLDFHSLRILKKKRSMTTTVPAMLIDILNNPWIRSRIHHHFWASFTINN